LLLFGLLAMIVLWAAVMSYTVAAHTSATADVLNVSEPLSLDAQQIYRSLSDADATEAAAFLSGGLEPARLRLRYQADIARAARRLETATAAAGGSAAGSRLATLTSGLPVYTGLVETARANNRLGLPVGAAYLRQASGLMRGTLLPAARDLYAQENAQLAAAEGGATAFPYLAAALAVIVGFGLFWSQRWLTRRTNRLFNPGLLAASVAGLVTLVWLVTAISVARSHLLVAQNRGSAPVEAVARADIAALQAHADESLTLIDRGGDDSFQRDFLELQKQLGPGRATLLTTAATIARNSPGGRSPHRQPAMRMLGLPSIDASDHWTTADVTQLPCAWPSALALPIPVVCSSVWISHSRARSPRIRRNSGSLRTPATMTSRALRQESFCCLY
jgi:hypothetical protein